VASRFRGATCPRARTRRCKSTDCGWSSPFRPSVLRRPRQPSARSATSGAAHPLSPSAGVRTDAPKVVRRLEYRDSRRRGLGRPRATRARTVRSSRSARRARGTNRQAAGLCGRGPSDAAWALRGADCCMRMMAPEPDAVDPIVEATARRVVELLRLAPVGVGFVNAAVVAERLGVSRGWVYRHADALGAVRLGTGRRARMRFDLARAVEAAASLGEPVARPSQALRALPGPRPSPPADIQPLRARHRW
jgi:hypothetical protein